MAEVTLRRCDVCGIDQREANHWFAWWSHHGMFTAMPEYESVAGQYEGAKYACGEARLHKAMSQHFAKSR